jgi:phosphohistidine phosphatase
MQLYFLRHGEAARNEQLHDAERSLTEVGQRQATIAGETLAQLQAKIDLLVTSPLLRARETSAIVQSFVCAKRMAATEDLATGSHPKRVCDYLRTMNAESALLIGHEPFLSEMISLLIADVRHAQIDMHCCSLASVKIESSLHYGSGTLDFLVHPDLMQRWLKR